MQATKLAVITGASSGIGREIARELARRGYSLFLTGQSEDRLTQVANEVRESGVSVTWECYNLADQRMTAQLADRIMELKPDVLINNAGFGLFGDFSYASMSDTAQLQAVNCQALTQLMHAAIEGMSGKEGYILNVGSVAGLLPAGPHLASYYASKAYVVSLSLGVRQEMIEQRRNIHISVLCPGPVDTNFNERAGVRFALPGKKASQVAEQAVKGLFAQKAIIVPGAAIRLSVFLGRLLPKTVYVKLLSGQQRKKGNPVRL